MSRKNQKKNAAAEAGTALVAPQLNWGFITTVMLILAATLYICWSWISHPGQVPAGHDIGAHLARTQLYFEAWRGGQWPPRWIEWVTPGYGHALFTFYPPGYSILSSLLMWLGVSWQFSTAVTIVVITILGMAGMFTWLKHHHSPLGWAWVSTFLFAMAPYRFLQLSVRAAFPEYLATSLLPWFGWSLAHLNSPVFENKWIFITALMWSLMLITHQPTALMAGMMIVGYMLMTKPEQIGALLQRLCAVVVIMLGLSSWFLVPLALERSYINSNELISNYYDFHLHFLTLPQTVYSPWGPGLSIVGVENDISFSLGVSHWLALILLVTIIITTAWKTKKISSLNISVALVCAGSLWLTLSWSLPIWERFLPLAFLQYPWRWMIIPTLMISWWVGVGLPPVLSDIAEKIGPHHTNNLKKLLMAVLLLGLIPSLWQRQPSAFLNATQFDVTQLRAGKTQLPQQTKTAEVGYLPAGKNPPAPPTVFSPLILSGTGEVAPLFSRPHRHVLATNGTTELTIQLPVRSYPGWELSLDGQVQTIPGLGEWIMVTVPVGDHLIELRYTADWPAKLGLGITIGTVLLWLGRNIIFRLVQNTLHRHQK